MNIPPPRPTHTIPEEVEIDCLVIHNYQANTKIFEESYQRLLATLDDKITFVNIVNVITRSTEIVDTYKKVTGLEKKMMVIKMVTLLIEKHESEHKLKKALIDLLNTVGVSIIDTIIYASKGKLLLNVNNFKKLKNSCFKCCS
jgi:hypothetical protein